MPSPVADRFVTAAFAVAIAAPAIGWASGLGRPGGELELRRLAPAPAWPPGRAADFARSADRWVADHFGWRESLTRLHHALTFFLLRDTPNPDVIRGRDGWLFLATANAEALHRRQLPALTMPTLRAWRRVLAERTAYLAARGARHVFVIPPQKETVYPEQWPAARPEGAGTDRFDQLCDDLAGRPETGFVDLRAALREARREGKVFHAHDVHWTDLGSTAACVAIARALGWQPLDPRRLVMQSSVVRGGDLARLCGVDRWLVESVPMLHPQPPFAAVPTDPPDGGGPWDRRWVRPDAPHLPRAVALGDSFLYRLQRPLAEHCSTVSLYSCAEFDVDRIAAGRPDVVLVEMVELTAVQTIPLNPVAVRVVPDATTLARLAAGLPGDGGATFGTVALVGASIDAAHGELVLAWRAIAQTVLDGRLHIELLTADGTVSFAHRYPRDPIQSAVDAGRTWLDHVPLPGDGHHVHAVRLRVEDLAGRPIGFDGTDRTPVVIVRRP